VHPLSWTTPAFGRTFGYEPGEFEQGAAFWQSICHPDDWLAAMRAVEIAVVTGGVYDQTTRMRHKKGHWVWTRSIGLMLRDENGVVYRGFGLAHDITELMEAKATLEKQCILDPLTDMLNRRGIEQALIRVGQQVQRLQCQAYAVLIDLDDFKQVNDTYGHAAGDFVLANTADVIRRTVRVVDDCGRLGGDEFIVFMLARDREEAEYVAERIRTAIDANIPKFDSEPIQVTISSALLPVCIADGACIDRLDVLLRAATPYLQRSKNDGKNRVVPASIIPGPVDD
jgi:diguanylate cyclase (GGDEF)-like protein/PAS domain S-box-containing protein